MGTSSKKMTKPSPNTAPDCCGEESSDSEGDESEPSAGYLPTTTTSSRIKHIEDTEEALNRDKMARRSSWYNPTAPWEVDSGLAGNDSDLLTPPRSLPPRSKSADEAMLRVMKVRKRKEQRLASITSLEQKEEKNVDNNNNNHNEEEDLLFL
jgi:hypothetical protein